MNMPTYDPAAVQPLRDELLTVGFVETPTVADVDTAILGDDDATVLLVVNSVCGCSAGSCRPGISAALQNDHIPDRLITVFAGQEKEALAHIRETYLSAYPPSSPVIALFKGGKIVGLAQRSDIQETDAGGVNIAMRKLFDKYCTAVGPSIPAAVYDALEYTITCGSKIARLDGSQGSC